MEIELELQLRTERFMSIKSFKTLAGEVHGINPKQKNKI
jgi:hypothetical protein